MTSPLGGSLDYVKDGFIAARCNTRLERAGVVFKHQRWITSDPNNRSCHVACHYSGSQVLELAHCATAFSMQSCAESAYQPHADEYH